mgnify:CR=1 FL=1
MPDAAEIELATSLGDGVTLLTLAPEQVPAESIRKLVERGAILAAGADLVDADLADDRFHPSAEGHRRAAAAFVEGLTAAVGPCVPGKDTV